MKMVDWKMKTRNYHQEKLTSMRANSAWVAKSKENKKWKGS